MKNKENMSTYTAVINLLADIINTIYMENPEKIMNQVRRETDAYINALLQAEFEADFEMQTDLELRTLVAELNGCSVDEVIRII
ncbi:MAG: hypothetical protein WCO98_05725 [bacterium]